jgi:hypothetical protein
MKRIKVALYAALAALAAFVALAPITVIRAQSGDVAAAITKLENDSVKADLAGDKSFTEKYLADDWMGCDSSGKWFTRAEVLKMLADPKNNKYNSEKLSDLKVRVYANGNAALATYADSYDALVAGEHRTRTILTTDVWVKIGSDWKEVNSHSTTKK